jgi:uncharacterized protein (DUF2147 family)
MRTVFILLALFATTLLFGQSTDSPTGRWITVDDETGEGKSVVEISSIGSSFEGKIVAILMENKTAKCTKCSGEQKNEPIEGLTIISGLTADDNYWANGTILDPSKGKTYGLSIWYENNDPTILYVRGKHWTGVYRTQTWKRQ